MIHVWDGRPRHERRFAERTTRTRPVNRKLPDNLAFERIGSHHAIDRFECGKEPLDRYLRESARRDRSSGIAAVFVLAAQAEVIGYYTLHQHIVEAREMPEKLRKRLSYYPGYPATLIGRLAVDKRHAGHGYGRDLLYDALARAFAVTPEVASLAVVVDALDAEAQAFYEHYGFISLGVPPKRRLWLPMKTVEKLLEKVIS
jgi:GNAT superfamily N-acetyltransferase